MLPACSGQGWRKLHRGSSDVLPVAGEGAVPRQILVAARRCSPLNMSLPTASSQSAHDCSSPVVGGPVVEVDKIWDVASTPTLAGHLSSGSSGRGDPLPFLLSSKPGSTTLDSDIDVSDLLADLPEVLRAGMNNGSLVPAYGSTGESFFSSLAWESFILSLSLSVDGEDSDLSRGAARVCSPIHSEEEGVVEHLAEASDCSKSSLCFVLCLS